MKYLKHYWISKDGSWATATNPVEKRHPEAEYAGLGVKVWMNDPDGIDVCLSTVPDETTIESIVVGTKNAVQELTEAEYNSVWNPLQESMTARQEAMEAEMNGDSDTAATKNALADTKYAEATAALNAL
jgi:hypothetical protein